MAPIYNIDFTKLATWLTPPKLRSAILLNFLKILVGPISILYNTWRRYYVDVNYRLSITGQVYSLEYTLNNVFDPDQRRITLTDTFNLLVNLIDTDTGQNTSILYRDNDGYDNDVLIINTDSAYSGSGYDFNVNIPFLLTKSQEYKLKSILDTYKLAGKRYKLLYI